MRIYFIGLIPGACLALLVLLIMKHSRPTSYISWNKQDKLFWYIFFSLLMIFGVGPVSTWSYAQETHKAVFNLGTILHALFMFGVGPYLMFLLITKTSLFPESWRKEWRDDNRRHWKVLITVVVGIALIITVITPLTVQWLG
jgi:hypothetical protein